MILNALTNKRYVGSTKMSLSQRFSVHRYNLRNHKSANPSLQEDWDKYSENSFAFIVLENTTENNIEREQYWIDKFKADGFELYNRCPNAADHNGLVMPVEPMKKAQAKSKETRKQWTPKRHAEFVEKCRSRWTSEVKETFAEDSKTWWENHPRLYRFRSPSGEIVEVTNLSTLCKEHHLNPSAMIKVHKGAYGRNSHKGWTRA